MSLESALQEASALTDDNPRLLWHARHHIEPAVRASQDVSVRSALLQPPVLTRQNASWMLSCRRSSCASCGPWPPRRWSRGSRAIACSKAPWARHPTRSSARGHAPISDAESCSALACTHARLAHADADRRLVALRLGGPARPCALGAQNDLAVRVLRQRAFDLMLQRRAAPALGAVLVGLALALRGTLGRRILVVEHERG